MVIRPQLRVIRSSLRQLERAVLTLATEAPGSRARCRPQRQYMGYMGQLKPRQKAHVRAAKEKGGHKGHHAVFPGRLTAL